MFKQGTCVIKKGTLMHDQSINSEQQHRKIILAAYPFLDDEMVDACLAYIKPLLGKSERGLIPDLVFEAFQFVSRLEIAARYPKLSKWQITEICDRLLVVSKSIQKNCFHEPRQVERAYDEVTRLPSSSEDVNELLANLRKEHNPEVIKTKLLTAIIYIRNERRSLSSRESSEGDFVVADIENNIAGLLSSCTKSILVSIYGRLRELVAVSPKLQVFGININELRESVACYHENRPTDDPFYSIAEEIREAVHRRLSKEVIETINELLIFLKSEETYTFISGRYCEASQEQKKSEMESPLFWNLLLAQKQLQLIWTDPLPTNRSFAPALLHSAENRSFLDSTTELFRATLEKYEDHIRPYDSNSFIEHLKTTIQLLEKGHFDELSLGPTRYALNVLLFDLVGMYHRDKGKILLNLMTLDCLLENISLIFYSNIVNAELATIDDENYPRALSILPDLVLCARASGHGTSSTSSLALSMLDTLATKEDVRKIEIQSFIREINEELLSFIYAESQSIRHLLESSARHHLFNDINRLHSQLLNDIIREKTTHLCGNLLSSISRYLGGSASDATLTLVKSKRHKKAQRGIRDIHVKDFVFRFGPDIEVVSSMEANVWFMGGKGASQAEISRLIIANGLKDVDVPNGFGLSTQTWRSIKKSKQKQEQLKQVVRDEVKTLELRTSKKFGSAENPLILVARSGAVVSTPGLLPTIAHIGLNDQIVREWSTRLEQPFRAYHAYLRFLFNYSKAVFRDFGVTNETLYGRLGIRRVTELCVRDVDALIASIMRVKETIAEITGGSSIPDDGYEQLIACVTTVLASFERDVNVNRLRGLKSIPKEYQTACLIQDCLPILSDGDCSGVYLTRNPLDGGDGQIEFIHDFGEDLAGGLVRPGSTDKFSQQYPSQSKTLAKMGALLEMKYASPTDIEFSIRNERLHILQTRPLKLAPMADVVTNYKIFQRGLMSQKDLIHRTRRIIGQPLINTFIEEVHKQNNIPIAFGQPIASGAVAGRILFDVNNLEQYSDESIIFITHSNVPKKVTTQPLIDGYISEEGGVTSHAALVSIGKLPCIVGVKWNALGNSIYLGENVELQQGDIITLDANDGYIYKGALPIRSSPENNPEYLEAEKAILEIIRRLE